jgi:HEAT repeat protein
MRSPFWLALLFFAAGSTLLLAGCGGPVPNTRSEDPYEKFLGIRELAGRTDATAIKELVGFLDDPHYLVVVGAIDVLAAHERAELIQHFVPKLKHPHPMVRQAAAAAIARIRNAEGVPGIVELLKDPEPAVRRSALKALVQFPASGAATRAIVDAVADKDPSVSYMAHRLLSERTNRKDVPQTRDDWAKVVLP